MIVEVVGARDGIEIVLFVRIPDIVTGANVVGQIVFGVMPVIVGVMVNMWNVLIAVKVFTKER